METKEIKGIVQDKNINSLKVNNYWIKFFDTELIKSINKNDSVNIQYLDNEKDGKVYHNGKKVTKLQTETKDRLDTTTLNTLIMTVKDIYIEILSNEKDISMEQVTNEVIESYKKIKKELS